MKASSSVWVEASQRGTFLLRLTNDLPTTEASFSFALEDEPMGLCALVITAFIKARICASTCFGGAFISSVLSRLVHIGGS